MCDQALHTLTFFHGRTLDKHTLTQHTPILSTPPPVHLQSSIFNHCFLIMYSTTTFSYANRPTKRDWNGGSNIESVKMVRHAFTFQNINLVIVD